MRLRQGTIVVVEGVDSAGKSTLIDDLLTDPRWSSSPARLHMPSGASPLTTAVYDALEAAPADSGFARQLFHLACHAENAPTIGQHRHDTGLVLDRWWWSTLAYSTGLPANQQRIIADVVESIWSQLDADLVCCMFEPLRDDANNSDRVTDAYHRLAGAHGGPTLLVPHATRAERVDMVVDTMRREGFLAE